MRKTVSARQFVARHLLHMLLTKLLAAGFPLTKYYNYAAERADEKVPRVKNIAAQVRAVLSESESDKRANSLVLLLFKKKDRTHWVVFSPDSFNEDETDPCVWFDYSTNDSDKFDKTVESVRLV